MRVEPEVVPGGAAEWPAYRCCMWVVRPCRQGPPQARLSRIQTSIQALVLIFNPIVVVWCLSCGGWDVGRPRRWRGCVRRRDAGPGIGLWCRVAVRGLGGRVSVHWLERSSSRGCCETRVGPEAPGRSEASGRSEAPGRSEAVARPEAQLGVEARGPAHPGARAVHWRSGRSGRGDDHARPLARRCVDPATGPSKPRRSGHGRTQSDGISLWSVGRCAGAGRCDTGSHAPRTARALCRKAILPWIYPHASSGPAIAMLTMAPSCAAAARKFTGRGQGPQRPCASEPNNCYTGCEPATRGGRDLAT